MTVSVGWKKKGPLLLAAVVIAGLAVVTLWVRRPANVKVGKEVQGTAAIVSDGVPGETAPASQGRHDTTSRATNALEMQQKMKDSIARRAALREQQVRASNDSKQQAVARYRAERVDPAWAAQKEAELTAISSSAGLAATKIVPKSLDIDCRSTMCRMNGSFSSDGEAEDWALFYMTSVGSALPNSVVSRTPNPDGSTSVEIYGKAR